MEIVYKRFRIREARTEDASLLVKWWNDGSIMAHAGFPNGLCTTAEEVTKKLLENSTNRLIMELDGIAIGEMCYKEVEPTVFDIGIKICDFSKHELGYGRIMLSMLIKYLFVELRCSKVILDTDLENKRAQHVYELLGFKKVNVKENSWINQVGELRSVVYYELVENDFIDFAL